MLEVIGKSSLIRSIITVSCQTINHRSEFLGINLIQLKRQITSKMPLIIGYSNIIHLSISSIIMANTNIEETKNMLQSENTWVCSLASHRQSFGVNQTILIIGLGGRNGESFHIAFALQYTSLSTSSLFGMVKHEVTIFLCTNVGARELGSLLSFTAAYSGELGASRFSKIR